MTAPSIGDRFALVNQPGVTVIVTRVWSERNEVHHRNTEYVGYDLIRRDGTKYNSWSTMGNWHLGASNRIPIALEPHQ